LIKTIDWFREVLSLNSEFIIECLSPLALAQCLPWKNEEEYLNNVSSMAELLKSKLNASVIPQMIGGCSLKFEHAKMHKRIWVDYKILDQIKPCEIGDILIITKYLEPSGIVSRNVSLIQVKAQQRTAKHREWHIDPVQSHLYANWPEIKECYVGRSVNRTPLFNNLSLQPRNRLFSPYLFIGTEMPFPMACCGGAYSWVTGSDLVRIATRNSAQMRGPLELSFLSFLIQMFFQTTGERDIVDNKTDNANVRKAIDAILDYVKLHDPPEGEGRPFIVMSFTFKATD
jgi:hypothetical protein